MGGGVDGSVLTADSPTILGFVTAGQNGAIGRVGAGGGFGAGGYGAASGHSGSPGVFGNDPYSGISSGSSIYGNMQADNVQATQLVISPIPSTLYATTPDQYPVYVVAEDANGNIAPTFSGVVTLAMGNNLGFTLEGTSQETAANGTIQLSATEGVAEFTSLAVNEPGPGLTLQATATGLSSATTNSFNVIDLDQWTGLGSNNLWSDVANWSRRRGPHCRCQSLLPSGASKREQ